MALRISSPLLWLLIAGPLCVSGRAMVRPETRVGGSPGFSSVFASELPSQVTEPHQEKPGCGYDFAPGVHNYLYAHANPAMNTDPSGHFIAGFVGGLRIAQGLRTGYDTLVLATGDALRNTILGIQAGKQSDEILYDYIEEQILGAVFGYVAGKAAGFVGSVLAETASKLRPAFVFESEHRNSRGIYPESRVPAVATPRNAFGLSGVKSWRPAALDHGRRSATDL